MAVANDAIDGKPKNKLNTETDNVREREISNELSLLNEF